MEPQGWVVYSESTGKFGTVCIVEIKLTKYGYNARLSEPYTNKVHWLSLDDLVKKGKVSTCGYSILTKETWERDREALEAKRRETKFLILPSDSDTDEEARTLLNLPGTGRLSETEIAAAFRAKAKESHPDAGGDAEEFGRLSRAKDYLLERVAMTA